MSEIDRRTLLGSAALGLVAGSTVASAGTLAPPGPPAPTGVALSELGTSLGTANSKLDAVVAQLEVVETRTAIVPSAASSSTALFELGEGSYHLAGDLLVGEGRYGISTHGSTTIDLQGRTIRVEARGFGALVGSMGISSHLVVRNGRIIATGAVSEPALNVGMWSSVQLEDLAIEGPFAMGVAATNLRMRRCQFNGVSQAVVVDGSADIAECSVVGGAEGIRVGPGSLVRDCILRDMSGTGILASGAIVSGCTVANASTCGITLAARVRCEGNLIDGGRYGVLVLGTGRNTIRGNRIVNCGVAPYLSGAAIRINSTGANQIDGNEIADTPVGVDLAGYYSLVVRNTFAFCATPILEAPSVQSTIGPLADLKNGGDPLLNTDSAHPLANVWI